MAVATVCNITGTICGVDGSAKAGIQVRATIKSTELDQGGQVASGAGVTSEIVSAITQEDGTFSIEIVQGATIDLDIPDINLKKEVIVPTELTADFVSLI